ncbi:hypothetical protein ACFQ5J_06715 [Lacticaseibacillus baoqingensis]|uniref:Uncharacterized protein n=1 Tax=Lacticaseibacillus baoqingensis TaxID=2486013 RepID=A0ABW4E854_9LACO|nr:hypothetical protein [Lacticaseibacillus baoqingensis]
MGFDRKTLIARLKSLLQASTLTKQERQCFQQAQQQLAQGIATDAVLALLGRQLSVMAVQQLLSPPGVAFLTALAQHQHDRLKGGY